MEGTAHAAHEGDNLLTDCEAAVGGIGNLTRALDAGDDGLLDVVGLNLLQPQQLFGVVQSKGLYLHQHPAGAHGGDGTFRENKVLALRDSIK